MPAQTMLYVISIVVFYVICCSLLQQAPLHTSPQRLVHIVLALCTAFALARVCGVL